MTPSTTRHRMNPWRLEWLRMTRSPRGLALALVYLFFGLTSPLVIRYLPEITRYASSGVQIIAPAPRPVDGIVDYVSQTSQTGLLVVIVVAAGALALDARRGLAAFYRTRAPGPYALIWPRFVAVTVAATVAYLLGLGAAWAQTAVLLGRVPFDRLVIGLVPEVAYLGFAVGVVAAAATFVRSTLGTVGLAAVVTMVVVPLLGTLPSAGRWLPGALMRAPAAVAQGRPLGDDLRALAVTVLATAGLLALAAYRARRRETA